MNDKDYPQLSLHSLSLSMRLLLISAKLQP